LNVVAEIGQSV